MSPDRIHHVSVMVETALDLLDLQLGETWVDATTGVGGHTMALAERVGPHGKVIAVDQDVTMLMVAKQRLAHYPQVHFVQANFDQLPEILHRQELTEIDGLFADLGFCSDQLADPNRGMSFLKDGPLDMRLDKSIGKTAADIVAEENEQEIARILWEYGEERKSRRIARKIVEVRRQKPIRTTLELAQLVRTCVPKEPGRSFDPATRTFQALRIAVNDELGSLERLLACLPQWIKENGRVGMISFHSLEDRAVKHAFRNREFWESMTPKPISATEDEVRSNPRSRSAKLRVARRKGCLTS
ncbi:MAG: 16S rRNA (cytosine(1402)-N(4))-methyltransferase RsmH [Zavarzinella sp.]